MYVYVKPFPDRSTLLLTIKASDVGKGANAAVSMLDYFFNHQGLTIAQGKQKQQFLILTKTKGRGIMVADFIDEYPVLSADEQAKYPIVAKSARALLNM